MRWSLDDPLRQTVLLAGLKALKEERFEQAADRFREAGKFGLRDRRLGGLITLAVVKAGQRLLYSTPSRCEQAAALLDKAVQGSNPDPQLAYMLALAYKRQGKTNEARAAFRKIARPDANVLLQLGLLSLAENNIAQAEGEFVQAWSMDGSCYEIGYNLLLTQLMLGKVEECLELIPRAIELIDQRDRSGKNEDRRFLLILHALLKSCRELEGYGRPEPLLDELQPADEQRLLRVVRSLGQLDTVHTLLRKLAEARPHSAEVREAYVGAVLVKGKDLINRCLWTEAEVLLRPMARERGISRPNQIALYNLLGCCSSMTQDFDGAEELCRGDETVAERPALAAKHRADP